MKQEQELEIDQELGIARFKDYPANHIFTLKDAGNMSYSWGDKKEVDRNKAKIYENSQFDSEHRVHIYPEFGDKVVLVDESNAGEVIKCDSLVTKTPGLALSLCPADCFPIILTARSGPE